MVPTAKSRRWANPAGGERERDRATVHEAARGRLRVEVTDRRPILGPEHDRISLLTQRELSQAIGRRGAHDDMGRRLGLTERDGPGLQEGCRVGLGEPLASCLGLERMTHVGELERRAGTTQQAPERERVAIVIAPVIGDDDLRSHRVPLDLPVHGSGRLGDRRECDTPAIPIGA